MDAPDLLGLFIRPIHQAGLRYLIGGSVAAMYYSEPRFTIDIDVPVFLTPSDTLTLSRLFDAPGYYCPPEDVLIAEMNRDCNAHFNVIHRASGLKADFYPANRDPHFGWAWKNKRIEATEGGEVFVAPPEFVILWKLEYYRLGGSEKHLRDVSRILQAQEAHLDGEFLGEAMRARDLHSQLLQAKKWSS